MTDIVDPETRSRMMSSIRGKDTKPELIVRRYLHGQGFRFRVHVRGLPGRPDIVLPKYGTIVEVRGCFWHQHEGCPFATMPSTNREFWQTKLSGNRDRDLANKHKLEELDWVVFEVWECEVSDQEKLHNLAIRIENQDCS